MKKEELYNIILKAINETKNSTHACSNCLS